MGTMYKETGKAKHGPGRVVPHTISGLFLLLAQPLVYLSYPMSQLP